MMSENMDITNFHKWERTILYPYFKCESISDKEGPVSSLLKNVSVGNYVEALKDDECQKALNYIDSTSSRSIESSIQEFYKTNLLAYLENEGEKAEKVLFSIGVSCLQLFTQNNFCGPLVGPAASSLIPGLVPTGSSEDETREHALKELLIDTDGIYTMVSQPEYLNIARVILFDLKEKLSFSLTIYWWCARYCLAHQKVTDEHSVAIYDTLQSCLEKVKEDKDLLNEEEYRDIAALFHLEAAHCYLHYYHVKKAKDNIDTALSILGMDISLTGALGVRTKWQQREIAQLVAKVSFIGNPLTNEEQQGPVHLPTDLPKDVILNDDTRLNKVKFVEVDEDTIPNLRPIEQMAFFAHFLLIRKSQAQDDQLTEQCKAYLMALLQYPKNWSLQLSALVIRTKIESGETRSMERSLIQLEELVKAVNNEEPSRYERLKLIYSSLLLTQWNLQKEYASMLMRLGCVKTALEIFERLKLWEDVIICYNELQMRQRSAEIIKEQLMKEETPKLYCLLGDATDEIENYFKAWELSGGKSSRAQRCLGNYYYVRKNYSQAIEHFEISVKLNSLQFPVWQRLAYCALQAESWEKCASAYKRCSVLEPDNFECWNNMSQAYLKLGERHKAWKSLQEALRFKMDNWRLWDNYMLVSTTLGYMTQALTAYNRILQYKEKHVDTEILGRIVYAILGEKEDPDGRPMNTLHKKCVELLGRLSREVPTHPELWFLYAELTYSDPSSSNETKHTAMQYYRKSVAADTQKPSWEKNTDTVKLVIMRSLKLIEVIKEVSESLDAKAALSQLASVRALIRSIVILIKNNQVDIRSGEIVDKIKTSYSVLDQEYTNLNNLIIKLQEE